MIKRVYICDRCGKMKFVDTTDDIAAPKGWTRVPPTFGHSTRDGLLLCDVCTDHFHNVFMEEKRSRLEVAKRFVIGGVTE